MRFGFFGDVSVSGPEAAKQIKEYQRQLAEKQRKKDFKVWAQMYATPFARDLLYKDHLSVRRAEQRAGQLAKKPDSGVKAVAEVSKVSDKLVKTKQAQAKVKEEIKKKVEAGDTATAAKLAQADQMLEEKANKIEGQLAKRVNEGTNLAKAKLTKEKARTEVLQKRDGQAAAAPHLASVWAKHDALYERNRNKMLMRHDQAEMKAATKKAELARMKPSVEKDAKMERLRKEEADRRIKQELELAKLDAREAGRLDARAKVAGMKKIQ